MEDNKILDLFLFRSETAIAELEKQYGAYCRSVVARILPDAQAVEECVNDAYLTLWQRIPPEYPLCLRAYLSKIVRNIALSRYRADHAKKRQGVCVALDELKQCIPTGESATIDRIVLSELLERFLGTLSQRDRIIFVKRYWYFCTIDEIAAAGEIGISRVKMSLHRSRKALKKLLQEEGVYFESK